MEPAASCCNPRSGCARDDLEGAAAALLDLVLSLQLHRDPEIGAVAARLAALTGEGAGQRWWEQNASTLPPSPYPRMRGLRGAAEQRLTWLSSMVRGHVMARRDATVPYGPAEAQLTVHLPLPLDRWVDDQVEATRRSRRAVVELAVDVLTQADGRFEDVVQVVDRTWLAQDVPSRHVNVRVGRRCRQQVDAMVADSHRRGRPVTVRQVVVAALALAQLEHADSA